MPRIPAIFERIRKTRGGVAAIHQAFSEFPRGIEAHFDFYSSIMLHEPLPLSRGEREWLAVKTSQMNQCPYCIEHHREALSKSSRPQSKKSRKRFSCLTKLATALTREPWRASSLKRYFLEAGFSEAEWQHAVMVVGYFNFANRCAFAMDLELETNFTETCN